MQQYSLVAIVTLLSLLVYMWMVTRVGGARRKTGIAAPAMTGDPHLERNIRVHYNTLEALPVYLTSLWLFGLTVAQRYAYRNHTLSQLAAGGAVGVALGITAVYVMRYAESKMVRAEKSAVDGVQHLANNVTQNM